MKTVMLSWTNLNPTVKEVDTKKKFFGIYLYKVMIHAPGCRIIASAKDDASADEMLRNRIQTLRNRISFSYYNFSLNHDLAYIEKNARSDQLQYFIDIKKKFGNEIKIRIEEPTVSVYSNDQNLLYSIASEICPERLESFYRPKNSIAEALLNTGNIISTKANEFLFRVYLREQIFKDVKVKQQVGNYLYNLDQEIQLPKSLRRNLTSESPYFSGGYFYCNDEKLVTFINLVCPSFISRIYRLSNPEQ